MPTSPSRIARTLLPFVRRLSPRHAFTMTYGQRYASVYNHRHVDGWLSDAEALALYDQVEHCCLNQAVAVEIGSWVGKSSVVISTALRNKPDSTLYCVDPFNGDGDAHSLPIYSARRSQFTESQLAVFESNVRKYGCREAVSIKQGYSDDVARNWSQPIDFLFIDANHEYAAAKSDFLTWGAFVRPGGRVALHDVRMDRKTITLYGPAQVANELIVNSTKWEYLELVDSLLIAERTNCVQDEPDART